MKDKAYMEFLGIKELGEAVTINPRVEKSITGTDKGSGSAVDVDVHTALQNVVLGWKEKADGFPSTVKDPIMDKLQSQLGFGKTKTDDVGRISEEETGDSPLDILETILDDDEDVENYLAYIDEEGTESTDKEEGEGKPLGNGDKQINPGPKDDEKRESELKGSEGGDGMAESWLQMESEKKRDLPFTNMPWLNENSDLEEVSKNNPKSTPGDATDDIDEEGETGSKVKETKEVKEGLEEKVFKHLLSDLKQIREELKDDSEFESFSEDYDQLFEDDDLEEDEDEDYDDVLDD